MGTMKRISESQVLKLLASQNIWWESPYKIPPSFSKWTPRPYFELLYPLVKKREIRRAVVLMGPRRVGKTVMIHHTINRLLSDGVPPRNICYFSVDHPIYNGLTLEQLLDFYSQAIGVTHQTKEVFIFFDEIQYLRNWEIHLKALVDDYQALRCVASGSAAAALRLKSAESGAGRFTDFLLPPLTFHEYLTLLKKTDLVKITEIEKAYVVEAPDIHRLNESFLHYLNFGGYPEVIFSEEIQSDPGRYIKSDIIDKVLLRDLPSLYGIQDIQELNYLFTTLAFNTANEVSLEQLAKGSGVHKDTIKKYIEYLEAAFLVRVIHRIDRNARHFKRANYFKIYLTNPSMRSALFSPIADDDEAMGALVETAIFAQLFHSDEMLHYARWTKNGEVDIVSLKANQQVAWAMEAKWSDRYYERPEKLKSLLSFCRAHNLPMARVTTRSVSGEFRGKNVILTFMPASAYCFGMGYAIIQGKKRRLYETLSLQ